MLNHLFVLSRACEIKKNRSRGLVVHTICGLLMMTFVPNAQAAPATPADTETDGEEEATCEAPPSLDEARLITGRDFYARANQLYEQKDYLGAATSWEQVLLLMPDKEADLRIQLAHAYHYAYENDKNPAHLDKAATLFRAQLAGLEAGDPTRADIESELAKVEAEIAALAKAKADAQARREEEIRQEQRRLNKQALADAEIKHQRNLQKVYFGVGGTSAGLGLASLATMSAFLVGGTRLDTQGENASQSTGVPDGYYNDQLNRGVAHNRAALATGLVGGILTAAGGAVLIVAGIRQKRLFGKRGRQVAITPTFGGAQLHF